MATQGNPRSYYDPDHLAHEGVRDIVPRAVTKDGESVPRGLPDKVFRSENRTHADAYLPGGVEKTGWSALNYLQRA
jgi:hypothetical protein